MNTNKNLLAIFLLLISFQTFGEESTYSHNPPPGTELCYGYSTIAYDSVINSRLGVPPETAAGLAKISANIYSVDILKIIIGAYQFNKEKSPHDYALQVFTDCIRGKYSKN